MAAKEKAVKAWGVVNKDGVIISVAGRKEFAIDDARDMSPLFLSAEEPDGSWVDAATRAKNVKKAGYKVVRVNVSLA